ncbi:MAG TPA: hypothetical protein VFO91_09680 [Anaerolineales bacterium]|nr:hypothetical protein [Anaerolineales bacterium]
MYRSLLRRPANALLLLAGIWMLYVACWEFYHIAWGSGIWLGQFSFKWALAFLSFVLFCVFCAGVVAILLWSPQRLTSHSYRLSAIRERLGPLRWVLALLVLIVPVWFLQYTFYGAVLHRPYLRILLWSLAALSLGVLLTRGIKEFLTWPYLLAALVLTSGIFNFFAPLAGVTSYPFSLGWSEGNRLWDYSILFGRELYDYPANRPIPVLLDIGRQFVGGIPFLFPGITIWHARLWIALTNIVPYLILGWIAFRLPRKYIFHWILAGIWAFTFVRQGPIHPPLLLSAIVVAFAWGQSLWIAIPLVIFSSYFAEASRFTWMFAPGMWAGMLEMSGVIASSGSLSRNTWIRAISVGLAGLFGGFVFPRLIPSMLGWFNAAAQPPSEVVPSAIDEVAGPVMSAGISDQPLLWYRLFPNASLEYGILGSLLLAVAPLVVILIYLSAARRWPLNTWQKLAIILPLFAFLVVGLIVSVKIGGGGNLHNLDMFLIGLLFATAIAWRNGGREWILQAATSPTWVRGMALLMIIIPGLQPLMNLAPISIAENMPAVMTLADISPEGPLPDTLPSEADTMEALERITEEVEIAASSGDVLFIDQRQLLTFGYIEGIPLVPEYDKKVLINQAMGDDALYFQSFYQELASQRFSLIISNPLHMRIQTGTDDFSEENNAWVKWVSIPVLCYYEPVVTLRKVTVQLLVPRQDVSDCDQMLPFVENE